ncbi:uncharacterized membrane protein YsdA (DUF1294 family) [Virgibacillus natechei]|uniref:Uncharacterized membrane protein YsdA (DUF1294 family) n=1 Tax=Virgibacillus natechei TaxID=1216297 RepID=A0ABS4ID34_9BACI|nr:DUF1294 domain-containing protein [Virgibacillus natechei]MBP1968854.1 uncharacterized membrane protein YsdA (DUF1294 family) [Virgibacillus natechei]UZD11650.1 DUF1294 domain-containing protein [Virgibacillus natechei]
MNEANTIVIYILGVSAITFFLMGMDKQKAKKQQFRIPERTFWILSILGGSFGSYMGMKMFRHKTKHRSFVVGVPMLIIIHCTGIAYLFFFMS